MIMKSIRLLRTGLVVIEYFLELFWKLTWKKQTWTKWCKPSVHSGHSSPTTLKMMVVESYSSGRLLQLPPWFTNQIRWWQLNQWPRPYSLLIYSSIYNKQKRGHRNLMEKFWESAHHLPDWSLSLAASRRLQWNNSPFRVLPANHQSPNPSDGGF